MSDMGQQQSDMDLNGFQAAPFAALIQVSGRAVGKARASTLRASKLDVDALHLRVQALLDLVDGRGARSHADASAAVALVDEEAAIASERDAGGAGLRP
jgi:hypothetical protein